MYTYRDMEQVLDAFENGDTFFLYICIGNGTSSEEVHLGHLILLHFTK